MRWVIDLQPIASITVSEFTYFVKLFTMFLISLFYTVVISLSGRGVAHKGVSYDIVNNVLLK